MNQSKFKDPVSHVCLAGAVVASWSLTQEVTGSNPLTVMTTIFVTELAEFSENIQGKLNYFRKLHENENFQKFGQKNPTQMTKLVGVSVSLKPWTNKEDLLNS